MRPHRLLILTALSGLLASPIAAVAEAPQSAGPGRLWSPPANEQMRRFEREEGRRQGDMSEDDAKAEYGEERVELAQQVQALMDEGKCREARALANEHGERQMALRVRQTCRAR